MSLLKASASGSAKGSTIKMGNSSIWVPTDEKSIKAANDYWTTTLHKYPSDEGNYETEEAVALTGPLANTVLIKVYENHVVVNEYMLSK